MKILIFSLLLVNYIYSQNYTSFQFTCPIISCSNYIDDGVCYRHSGTSPVSSLLGYPCNGHQVCQVQKSDVAWVEYYYQQFYQSFYYNSQVYQKQTEMRCQNISSLASNLQNGRRCNLNGQCITKNCNKKFRCEGEEEFLSCSSHSDCQVGFACIASNEWPFSSKCQRLRSIGEQCYSDEECVNQAFCGYLTSYNVTLNQKNCLQFYSQTTGTQFGKLQNTSLSEFDDLIFQGRYCQSGITISVNDTLAECAEITYVETNYDSFNTQYDQSEAPYKCTFNLFSKDDVCKYYYVDSNGDSNLISSTPCECPLSIGGTEGFCPYPGQIQFNQYAYDMKELTEHSGCMRADLFNFQAQKECGAGASSDYYYIWENAVKSNFNMTYWANIQDNVTINCVEELVKDSYLNLVKGFGIIVQTGIAGIISLINFL